MSSEAARRFFEAATIDRSGGQPPYRQIAQLVHDAVVHGELRTGTKLPAERELARLLGVGRATVARALSELGDTGLLERRVGHGTVVAFDAATWRAGPTPGIPWGALLTTFEPSSSRTSPKNHDRRAAAALAADGADRGPESIVLTAGVEDGTRFLVDALVGAGERVILEVPASPALSVSLAMRHAEVIELASESVGIAPALEQLLDGQPGAKLVWLRGASALRRRGDRAHIAGLTKRLGLPLIEEPPHARAAQGLLGVDPHDHVVRVGRGWISAPEPLARLLAPLAVALGVGQTPDG